MILNHLPSSISGICAMFSVIFWLVVELLFVIKEKNRGPKAGDKRAIIIVSIITIIICWASYYVLTHEIGYLPKNLEFFSWVGIFVLLIGVYVRQHAKNILGRFYVVSLQIQKEHKLIEDGPFSVVRHPCYTGYLLSLWGMALILNNWIFFLIVFLSSLLIFLYQIAVEENQLINFFGEQYIEYKKRTKKLFPYIY